MQKKCTLSAYSWREQFAGDLFHRRRFPARRACARCASDLALASREIPLTSLLAIVALGTIGLLVGSFIATVVTRYGSGRSALAGRSRCDSCGAPVLARQLVPLFSFAIQRGRARCCGASIDRVHPLAEIAAAGIGAASGLFLLPFALAAALLGWLLLTLALIDARAFTLPDPIVALLACAGLSASILLGSPPFVTALIGMVAGYVALEAVRRLYRHWRGRDGIGRGDPKMFAAIGAWVGWEPLPTVLLGAALAGLGWALVSGLVGRRIGWSDRLPLGSLLALAAWPAWLWWIGSAAP